MPRLANPVRWRDQSGAVVQKVTADITLQNAVPFSMNLLYEENLGEALSRKGTDIIGSQLSDGNTCEGLFQHIDSTPASSKLFAAFSGTIHDVLGGTNATGLTAGNKVRFMTFLNTTLALNGAEKRAYTAAGGWVSSGSALDLNNLPANAKFPIELYDRVYCVTDDDLNYTTTPTSGAVSWVNSGSGSLKVEQEDGGGLIQGIGKVPGYLLILKERSMKRWNTESTFPEDLVRVGTQSHESIVTAKGRMFFFYGPNGFYETNGGYPTLISRPIQRLIEAIPASNYGNIYGWTDDEHIWWAVGDLTVDFDRGYTETYANVVLRYTIRSQQWAPLQYYNSFNFLHQYVVSGSPTVVIAGDDDGNVLQLDTGTTDYDGGTGKEINYILQSPEFYFTDRSRLKTVSESITVHHDLATGAILQGRLDYGEWKQVGTINRDIVSEVELRNSLNANIFEFRIVDSITGEQIKLRGLDFPNVFIHRQAVASK